MWTSARVVESGDRAVVLTVVAGERVGAKLLVREDGTIPVLPVVLDYGTAKHTTGDVRQVPVSGEMVAELYEWSRKRLGLDLGLRYWKRRVEADHEENHTLTKLAIYALAADLEVLHRFIKAHFDSLDPSQFLVQAGVRNDF